MSSQKKRLLVIKCSYDYTKYSFLELDDSVLFLFDHKELILINKLGLDPIISVLNNRILGKCISDIYKSDQDTEIIFATKLNGRIQFVKYDFMKQQRITQTQSWNMNKITNLIVEDSIVYAVLDYSMIVCCDMDSGKVLWTRFETAKINSGLATYKENLLYCCQNAIKLYDGYKTSTVRVPYISVSSILHLQGSNVICSCKNLHNVCEYNIETDSLSWEIVGQSPIQESIAIGEKYKENALFVRIKTGIGVIDLKTGISASFMLVPNAVKMRYLNKCLVVHTSNANSLVISGSNTE